MRNFLLDSAIILAALASTCVHAQSAHHGRIASRTDVVIKAEMGGVITSAKAALSDNIKRKQTIAILVCGTLKGKHRISEAKLALAKAQHDNNVELNGNGAMAKHELKISQAKIAIAKAEERQSRSEAARCVIKAPTSGTIVQKYVDVGQYVKSGDALYHVIDTKTLYGLANIPRVDYDAFTVGEKVNTTINGRSGSSITATIIKKSKHIGQKQSFIIELEFDSINGLASGMAFDITRNVSNDIAASTN